MGSELSWSGKIVMVTGAAGLVGTALVTMLKEHGARVVAIVRDIDKANRRLPEGVEIVAGDVTAPIAYAGKIDYVVHAASPTSSRMFAERPVEVIDAVVCGAKNVLDFAVGKQVKGIVLLSTMEVYGLTDSDNVAEDGYAALDTMSPRSCYPEAKRLAECMFASYAKEYGIRAMVARLTQTFGYGVSKEDNRVFAQFARAIREGRDIVLKSEGITARCYCSLGDAVSAIAAILARGEAGIAYNVANPDTFCTIREMAEMVASEFSGGRSEVVVEASDVERNGYLPPFRMRLNVDRLRSLGWKPRFGLKEMFRQVIESLGQDNE